MTDVRMLGLLNEAVGAQTPVVMATIVSTESSVPRRSGTKMLIYEDGTQVGTVGGGAMEHRVVEAARESLRTGNTQLLTYSLLEPTRGDPGVCGGTVDIYLEPYMPEHTVFVIGAGHIGRAVVDLADWLGYRTIVTDDREGTVSAETMPKADFRHHGTVSEALAKHKLTENTSVVVVSRNAEIDIDAVPQLLGTPARYIGVMGSRRRWQTVRKQLLEAGVDDSSLERIHTPVGIELHAETVEEIAVSILSEVIKVTREPNAEDAI
jgi:xanthine dehydrogenase accessory factor